MFNSTKYERLTSNLRLAINRLKLLEKKKTEQAIKARKEIADYLAAGKEERARIRVEHIVREDYLVEALEIVEMYCDLLLARMGLIQSTKDVDEGLEGPIASIIWATPRLQSDCHELVIISDQLAAKYGKDYVLSRRANKRSTVNEKLIHKLSVQAPPRALIDKYLEEIAKTYNVPFTPSPNYEDTAETELIYNGSTRGFNDKRNGGGGSGGGGSGAGGGGANAQKQPFMYPPLVSAEGHAQPHPPGFILDPMPATRGAAGMTDRPALYDGIPTLPTVPTGTVASRKSGDDGRDVNFDDLTKRFQDLKKKK